MTTRLCLGLSRTVVFDESVCLGLQTKQVIPSKAKYGGRPIANKYREEDAKNFEKRVKKGLKLVRGNRTAEVVMGAYFPSGSWPAYLCASVGQRGLGRGSRSR